MRKVDLINKVAKDAEISKKAAGSVLDAFVGAIHDSLKNDKRQIRVPDLGTFKVTQRKARSIVNPRSGRRMQIGAGYVARFAPSKGLRISAKGQGRGQPETCDDFEGTVQRMLCKVCGHPVLRPALPFCRDHAPRP